MRCEDGHTSAKRHPGEGESIVSEIAWLFVAVIAVWVGLGVYLATLAVRQRKLDRRLSELERRS